MRYPGDLRLDSDPDCARGFSAVRAKILVVKLSNFLYHCPQMHR
jgi:hypothetical protein